MLVRRLATAVLAGPVVIAAVILGNPAFLILVAIAVFAAAGESTRLIRRRDGLERSCLIERAGALLVILASSIGASAILGAIAVLLGLFLSLPAVQPSRDAERPSWSDRLGAMLYASLPLSLVVLMRAWKGPAVHVFGSDSAVLSLSLGVAWVAVLLSITWAVDSVAYFVGRAIGRRPLSPVISPNKTWEGTVAGVIGGTIVAIGWAPAMHWSPVMGLGLGFFTSWAAVLGDLAESALKRRAGVKNAGSLLPGHGGILDRIDSLAFSAVVVFLLGTVDESTHILSLGS